MEWSPPIDSGTMPRATSAAMTALTRSNVPCMSVTLTSTSPISAARKASMSRPSLLLNVVYHIMARRTASGPPREPLRTTEAPSKGIPRSAALSPSSAPFHSSQPPARRSSASPFMVFTTVPGATRPKRSSSETAAASMLRSLRCHSFAA